MFNQYARLETFQNVRINNEKYISDNDSLQTYIISCNSHGFISRLFNITIVIAFIIFRIFIECYYQKNQIIYSYIKQIKN